MSAFQDAFNKIAEGLEDLSSLEVVTYKGTISIQANGQIPKDFDSILKNAQATANIKILASTKTRLDGDTSEFHDTEATSADIDAHHQLWESAVTKRAAIVKMFESAILDAIKK